MIHPDLATMLAVVTTDYPLEPGEAIEFLRPGRREDLQRDLGRRRALDERLRDPARERRERRRRAATTRRSRRRCEVCADLARQVVADGEGITVLAEINVTGAVDDAQAKAIARRIATSPLVKTALFGHDANWGRVLMAAGTAPLERRLRRRSTPTRSPSRYNGTVVLDAGAPTDVEPDVSGPRARSSSTRPRTGRAGYLTSDLSYDYVRINADYRT